MSIENLHQAGLRQEFKKIMSAAIDTNAPYAQTMIEELLGAVDRAGPFPVGELVRKVGGDYTWFGDVRCCYLKRSGVWRVVSENDAGLNHIFSPQQLTTGW